MRRHCANSKLAGEGNYPDIQAARPNTIVDLRSTVDYHNSLLDQARQQHELAQPPKAHSHRGHSGPNHHSLSSLRQWLGTTVNSNSTVRKKTNRNERDQLNYDMTLPPHPHLTRKEIEEFEALPIAIRRKVSYNIFHLILFYFFMYSRYIFTMLSILPYGWLHTIME